MGNPNISEQTLNFFRLAMWFEGSLILVALALGCIGGVSPLAAIHVNGTAISWGILGTIPLLMLFQLFYQNPRGELLKIKRILIEHLGPHLDRCRWYELLLLAGLAGISEEMLFRGVLQPWFESLWGWQAGIIGSNVLFALAHSITPLYAISAGAIGAYLGYMLDMGEQRNLLIPVIIHGVYDFIAFIVVIRSYQAEQEKPSHQIGPDAD